MADEQGGPSHHGVDRAAARRAALCRHASVRLLLAGACLFAPPVLQACGPYFPQQLLQDRRASVYDLVEGSFDFEAARLGTRVAAFKVNENLWEAPGASRIALEQGQLGAEGYARVEAMRLAFDDASAWAAGEGLDAQVRSYAAGARAFHAGEYVLARQHFDAVLALAPEQQQLRGLWARYMLGRLDLAAASGGAGLSAAELDAHAAAAAQTFQAVRAAVQAGAEDPLGLAVASLGEEAALHLRRGDRAAAARLYAEQAAQDSAGGRASLLFLVRGLFADEAALRTALTDPLLQRLLAAYVYTRSEELTRTADGESQPAPLLERYYAAVEAATGELAGIDRVAAAAYRAGRFELAAKLAARSEAALALWVRAKLALRRGDQVAATAAYAAASHAFPRDEDWGINTAEGYEYENLKPACRVDGERAVLALSRGEYLDALRLLHTSDQQYWLDEAHIAERVLTVDELKQFVDQQVAAPTAQTAASATAVDSGAPVNRDQSLRSLLGRRLLRVGRYADAPTYFPPELRADAQAYAEARIAAPGQGRIARAETLFRAARLARESGMELLGYELGPDAAVFSGAFDIGELAPAGPDLSGPDEAQRSAASAAVPALRFHYRYVAADLADQAADLVPARSQAFAAMLCSATGWVIGSDYATGRAYYARYVAEGAYLPWAARFGNDCPAPDFAAAAQRLQLERMRHAKYLLRRSAPFLAAGLFAAGSAILLWRWRRRRAK